MSSSNPKRTTATSSFAGDGGIPPGRFYASQGPLPERSPRTPPPQPMPQGGIPTSTPISKKISGSQPYSSSVPTQDQENRFRLAQETKGSFLGPMPVITFLDKFLPLASGTRACPESSHAFDDMPRQTSETAMYTPFVRFGTSPI